MAKQANAPAMSAESGRVHNSVETLPYLDLSKRGQHFEA
jgi:hypothetical protein